jgi:hypothetical protein
MTKLSFSDWIQMTTGISVLVGVALVVWELNQTKDLVQTQIQQATMSDYTQDNTARYGEGASIALYRACIEPENLQPQDFFILDAYFRNQISRILRLKMPADIAGYDANWRNTGLRIIDSILQFPMGKAWLTNFRAVDPEIQQFIETQLDIFEPSDCTSIIEALKQH